jgi:hypothetical protein
MSAVLKAIGFALMAPGAAVLFAGDACAEKARKLAPQPPSRSVVYGPDDIARLVEETDRDIRNRRWP